jgi:dipeptidyl aminopeptidase/acylaminoacyl peptidase
VPRPLEPEDLLRFRLPGQTALSKRGRLAYVETWPDKETNENKTAIYTIRDGQRVRLTAGDNDSQPAFSPDGTRLAFLSRRSGKPQVWILPLDGGEAWQLTKLRGGVDAFAWSPDGRRLGLIVPVGKEGLAPERPKDDEEKDLYKKFTAGVKVIDELFHKLDGVGYFRDEKPLVAVVDVAEGAEVRLLTEPPYRCEDVAWSADGRYLYTVTRRSPDHDREPWRRQIWRIPVAGGAPERLTPEHLSAHLPTPSPDGRLIAFIGEDPDAHGYDNDRLFVIPADGGEVLELAHEHDRTFGNVAITDMPAPARPRLVWDEAGRTVSLLQSVEGSTRVVAVDVGSGELTVLASGERVIYDFDRLGDRLVFAAGDPTFPGDVFEKDLTTGQETRLTALNADLLAEVYVARPRRYRARAGDGPEVDTWVLEPYGLRPGEKRPTVLEIHGGPMSMYGELFFFEFQLLAGRGYGVVYTNPRGSQGYGRAFCEAIRYEWGDKDYQDILAGLEEAIRREAWIDPERLGVAGGSYGGYMTNWIVGHTDRFKAAITMRSVVDWRAMVGTGDGGWNWMERAGGVPPWRDDTWYRQQSPITYVDNIVTPLLIEHQEGDLRCPIEQGEILYTAVKYLGKAPTRFIRYPDEFHGMSRNGKPWHRVHRFHAHLEWWRTYLEGQGEG